MDPMVGTVLAGKYALRSKLGQGGMGSVWQAEHVQLRSPVAIKLIDPKIVSEPEALARFMREAQAAAALRSPNVVQIFDYGADQGVPYIAMELLEGESLAARLERARILTPRETANVIGQVARAITKAHELGIIHRDLKPDNIFITHHDDEEIAKVLDFGIAKASNTIGMPAGSATRTGAVLGTPYYMSPEQADGKPIDARTDLWALGVITFECLVGRRPFDGEALGSVLLSICAKPLPVPSRFGRVPAGFDGWFARACARPTSERFQSAKQLVAELRALCGDPARDSHGSLGPSMSGVLAVSDGARAGAERPPTANAYGRSVSPEKPRARTAAALLGGVIVFVAIAGGVAFLVKQLARSASPAATESTTNAEPARPAPPTVQAPAAAATPVETAPTVAPVAAPSATTAASSPTAPSSTAPGPSPTPKIQPRQPQKRPAPPPAAGATTKAPAKEPAAAPTTAPSGADVLGI
jgi:serine/threonine-protein kinase